MVGKLIIVVKVGDKYATTAYDDVKLILLTEGIEVYKFTEPKKRE